MKVFFTVLFVILTWFSFSQTINMPAGNTATTMCSGNFYDSGGSGGNYGANQSRTLTICPSIAGNKVRAQFTAFAVENGWDFLYIYDGPTTASPSMGVYSGAVAPGVVQATTGNTSGCLTFRFTSDGSINQAGWAALISCISPCETINANLVSTSPLAGAGGIIRICQGSSVTFNGSGTFSSGSSLGATYSWNFGDGSSSPASSSTSASHAFSSPGIYYVDLNIVKAGCINYNKTNVIVQVSTTPSFSATSISSSSICLGQTATLIGSVTPTPFSVNCTPPISGTTFLPDGTGVSYSTCINVNCYSPGQLVTSASNIQNICLNMEHSYLGDLQIEIVCPNGTTVPLLTYLSGGGYTYLGSPLATGIGPGTGFNYCFAMGAPTNLISGPTVTAGVPAWSSIAPGTYAPNGNFSSLVGCPLNGSWCIKVTDNMAMDDGYIFGWDVNFNVIPATTASFTPNIVSQVWSGPNIISTSGNNATIQPTTTGTYCYTLTAVDNFSCTYNTVRCINVGPGPFAGNDNTLTICANGPFTNLFSLLGAGVSTSGTWSGPSTLTGGNLGGYNPVLASPGSYTYSVPGSGSCLPDIAVVVVVENTLPIVAVNSGTLCSGNTFTLTPSGALSYTYSSGINLISPIVSSSYTVTGINLNGCTNTAISSVSVIPKPNIIANNGAVCPNSTYTINPTGAVSYSFSSVSPIVSPTITTNYTITGTSIVGCTNTAICTVSINPTPTLTVNSGAICSGNSFTFIPTGASTYTYSSGSSIVSPTVTSTYTVIGSSALGCTNTAVRTISVNPLPIISVNSPTLCSGFTTTLIPTGASTYSWSTGVSSPSIAVSPTLTTNYTVTGTSLGCSTSTIANVAVSSSPTLSVNNATICAGQTATLIASGALLYAWSTGALSNSITVSPLSTTTYTVIGTNAIGCTKTNVVTVVVNPMPIVSVNSPTICAGQTATLTAIGASTYSWNTGSLLNPILVSPSSSTVYSVTGTSLGCSTTTVVTVVVNPLPVMSVNSSTICIGQTTTLTASGANSYLWNTGSVSNPFITSPLISTTYTVIGSTLGCTQLAISTVIVNPLPILSANSASICSGQSSLLSATGANTYTWSPGINLNTTTGSFVSANPSTSITYTILGTSISGCVNSTTSSLFVLATPSLIAVANPSAVCAGTSIDLTASGALNYSWTPAGVFTSSLTITPASTSVYSVLGENVSGGLSCTSTQTVLVTVLSPGVVTTSNTDSLCIGESKVVFASGGTTYSWVPTVGVTNPNAASTLVKPTVTTEYTVTVSTNGLCPGTGTVKIIVNPLPIVYAGNDTTINIDEAYVLNGTSNVTNFGFLNPAGSVLSCNFCSVVEVTPKVNTCYLLKAESSQQCVAYDEVCIKVTKEYGLFIPNAFSPNGDIDNDVFIPVGYGLTSIKLTVYDRWGTQVFKSHDDVLGWDGKCKGKICEQGVYVFYVVAQTIGGKEITKTGHLTLLSRAK